MREVDRSGHINLPENMKIHKEKRQDPRRPPWPILHLKAVEMREGKQPHDDLALVWEQTKYYYPHDWLIPFEIAQILKYSTMVYLQNYVADPEQMRLELIESLTSIRDGRVMDPTGSKISTDVRDILAMAIEDLQKVDFGLSATLLVPRNTG